MELARHRTGSTDNDGFSRTGPVHRADDFGIRWQAVAVRRGAADSIHSIRPALPLAGNFRLVGTIAAVTGHAGRKRLDAGQRIGHQRHRAMLDQIMRLHIQRHHLSRDQAVRAGGEILKTASDRQHDIRLRGEVVRRRRTGDAKRSDIHGMSLDKAGLAGLCRRHRNACSIGKGCQRL